MPPSSTYGPIYDCFLVSHVARVAESHKQPDRGWATRFWIYLAKDGSEDDIL
ncbi:MAG: hypothetical protein EWM73_01783 [Nitrospira sp.]|nr:MAG: hypothetical protein EWM73_01783 [Nitrospira sp.]